MERGLLWLPLLILFMWLAWSGWNEYQKVEAYQVWAKQFEKAKYDVYAVLGQNGNQLTWGKPTRKGPVEIKTFSLEQIQSICLQVDDHLVNLEAVPSKGHSIVLEFRFHDASSSLKIPFTEVSLGASWTKHLQQCLKVSRDREIE